MTIEEEIAEEAVNAAWNQFHRTPSSNPSDYAHAVTRALSPLLNRVRAEAQVEALDRAAGAIADLRPSGFTVIANVDARRRDGALWEAQSIVQRMVRDIEQNSEGSGT